MRLFLLFGSLLLPCAVAAQQPGPRLAIAPPAQIKAQLTQAMAGEWTGTIEFRDPSDPEQYVRTPTWLTIAGSDGAFTFRYTYDDEPNSISRQIQTIVFDVAASTYSITNSHGRKETYHVAGYDSLHNGFGDLQLVGPTGTGRPVETHITLSIRPNALRWTEENRPTALAPFTFRHRYVFTRAEPPKLPAKPGTPR